MKAKIVKISLQLFEINDESKIERLSKTLVKYITQYCLTENNLLEVYRLLRRIRYTIQINKDLFPQYEPQYDYLLYIIDTEIEINRIKTEQPDIRIKTRNEGHWYVIEISDKGMGMETENKSRIFEKFFREETGNPLFFTLDAGANVHLLFPEDSDSDKIKEFIVKELLQHTQNNGVVKDEMNF